MGESSSHQVIFSCSCSDQYSAVHSMKKLSSTLQLSISLHSFLLSSIQPCEFCLGILGLSTLFFQRRDTVGFCLFPSTAPWSRNPCKGISWDNHGIYLTCFLFQRITVSLCLIFNILKTAISYICMVTFKCFRWKGKYDLCYTILAEISLHLKRILLLILLQISHGPRGSTFQKPDINQIYFISTILLHFIHSCIHPFIIL